MNAADLAHLTSLRESTLDVLRRVVGPVGTEVALLDTPRHRNLGDSLIWHGEVAYLTRLGYRITYQADIGRFSRADLDRCVSASAVLLLHGGGNMGDLYPAYEEFRQEIITTYCERKIVVLPQSIHFSDSALEREASKIYARARDLTLLARDLRSLERMTTVFSDADVHFCPDMALGVELSASSSRSKRIRMLDRKDPERRAQDGPAIKGMDWTWSRANNAAYEGLIGIGAVYRRTPSRYTFLRRALFPIAGRANSGIRLLNVAAAATQFEGYGAVVTNRLHAHILATLMGIPNIVTDNKYGKISAVMDAYTGRFSTSYSASSLQEGWDTAQAIVSGGQV